MKSARGHLKLAPGNGRRTASNEGSNSVFEAYIAGLAPSGRSGVTSLLNRCAGILKPSKSAKDYPWQQLNYVAVAKLRSELLSEGYAVSSVNLALSALKGLCKTAFNMRLLDAEELSRIQSIRRVRGDARRKGRSLERTEVRALLEQVKQHPLASRRTRDRALVLVSSGAGLRAGELVSLQLEDFVLEHGELIVRQGKGRKYRSIHVSKPVLSAVKSWLKVRGCAPGPLFKKINKAGIPGDSALTKAGFASILAELASNAGVKRFTPHDLRRTFITHLLDQGVDINTVRQLAGHSDIATTARYDCRGDRAKNEASRAFSCW